MYNLQIDTLIPLGNLNKNIHLLVSFLSQIIVPIFSFLYKGHAYVFYHPPLVRWVST